MSTRMLESKDFWIGCVYFAAGAAGWWIAREYSSGTAGRMGPGYFPNVVSFALMFFGCASWVAAARRDGARVERLNLKGLVLVAGSVAAFAFLLPLTGFVPATAAMALMSAAASAKFKLGVLPVAALAALIAFCALIFIFGLGIPMPMMGSLFTPVE